MHKLLIAESPLIVLPTLVCKTSMNEALVLQQIHYWLNTSNHVKTWVDGVERTWVYNSYSSWQEQFPFWSRRTIRRAINKLEDRGVLLSHIPEEGGEKWYAVDYDALDNIDSESPPESPSDGGRQSSEGGDADVQGGAADVQGGAADVQGHIQETTTETTQRDTLKTSQAQFLVGGPDEKRGDGVCGEEISITEGGAETNDGEGTYDNFRDKPVQKAVEELHAAESVSDMGYILSVAFRDFFDRSNENPTEHIGWLCKQRNRLIGIEVSGETVRTKEMASELMLLTIYHAAQNEDFQWPRAVDAQRALPERVLKYITRTISNRLKRDDEPESSEKYERRQRAFDEARNG